MADELNNILSGTPIYGVEPESFLMNVISPLYQVIYKVILFSSGKYCNPETFY